MSRFTERRFAPMLIRESQPFDDDGWIYELKLDGNRALAYLEEDRTELRNRKNRDVTALFPELRDLYAFAKRPCVLDGELIATTDGKPDFYKLQKRVMTSSPFRIELETAENPVTFVAFDILWLDGELLVDLPLAERKGLLAENITAQGHLELAAYIQGRGRDFFELVRQQKQEGVVAKKLDGRYYMGKYASVWAKFKVLQEEEAVIVGYSLADGAPKDLYLGRYDGDSLVPCGKIYLGVSPAARRRVLEQPKADAPFPNAPEGVVWIEPTLVGAVKYLERTPQGGMRQPVFKGFRDDKSPRDCVLRPPQA